MILRARFLPKIIKCKIYVVKSCLMQHKNFKNISKSVICYHNHQCIFVRHFAKHLIFKDLLSDWGLTNSFNVLYATDQLIVILSWQFNLFFRKFFLLRQHECYVKNSYQRTRLVQICVDSFQIVFRTCMIESWMSLRLKFDEKNNSNFQNIMTWFKRR